MGWAIDLWRQSAVWFNWEATGTWVGGIATVGALLAALHATRQAQKAAEAAQSLAEKARAEALEEKSRGQAKSVYALRVTTDEGWQLRITNRSSLPIYRVSVYWLVRLLGEAEDAQSASWEAYEQAYEEDGNFQRELPMTPNMLVPVLSVIPPGGTYRVPGEVPYLGSGGPNDRVYTLTRGVEIVFTDAANVIWTRRQDGTLERASKDPLQLESAQSRRIDYGWDSHMDAVRVDPDDRS